MKKRKFLGWLLSLILMLCACGPVGQDEPKIQDNLSTQSTAKVQDSQELPESQESQSPQGFYVEGTTLYDANGNPFVMRGVNHAHVWFPRELETTLDALEEAGCNCVRIVLSSGKRWDETTQEELETIIEACKERGLVAVLEVHDTTGKTDITPLIEAAQFFVDAKDVLAGQEKYVILNIANEWPVNDDYTTWKKGYANVIPMLRNAGLNHTIMVDCAGSGQGAYGIAKRGQEIFEADPLGNLMFSVHMYGSAGGSAQLIEQNLQYAMDLDLCICVGEFGFEHTDGDVDEAYLMQYCEEKGIGYLAWSWKGNSAPSENLDLALFWDGSELSEQWGEVVINGPYGIKETSKLCTVYTQ